MILKQYGLMKADHPGHLPSDGPDEEIHVSLCLSGIKVVTFVVTGWKMKRRARLYSCLTVGPFTNLCPSTLPRVLRYYVKYRG